MINFVIMNNIRTASIIILAMLFLHMPFGSGTAAGRPILSDSEIMDRKVDSLIKAARKGEVYASKDDFDSAYVYLNTAVNLLSEVEPEKVIERDIFALPILYNAMGVYLRTKETDFKAAISYFHKCMKYSERYNLWDAYSSVAFNIVYIFFSNNDPDGIMYAQELYDKGISLNDDKMKSIGAYCLSSMYFIKKDFEKSRKYIGEVLDSKFIHLMEANTYSLKANLDRESGNLKSAEDYFQKAVENLDGIPASEQIYICLSYADFLIQTGKYSKAVDVIYKGLKIGENYGMPDFKANSYLLLSKAYNANAQWKSAYEAYRNYCELMLQTFNIQKQKEISELMLKYDTEKKEAALERKNLMIEYKNSQLYFAGGLILLMIIAVIAVYRMYVNKNRMYKAIMEKYKSDSERRTAERKIVTHDKSDMFAVLESLMNEKHIYRDKNLSRETLAETLSTNRTYLSMIISEATGKSFSQYVNSYRVAESVQLLSDKENNLSLKSIPAMVGFNSTATFYRIFQEEVGMPPAKFRELSRH